MQKSFDWSEHFFWEIRSTALTAYVGTCKGHLTDQNILPEKSEALHSQSMLEHAKIIWLIRTSFLRIQRHCTHILCWNMQRSFDWSEHPFWEIRGTALTYYVGTCKGHLTDQNIFPEKSEALHSHSTILIIPPCIPPESTGIRQIPQEWTGIPEFRQILPGISL